jgi:single-strand DNA-binding protein
LQQQNFCAKSLYRLTNSLIRMKNKVQLIGHLGNDPEVKQLEGGKTFARFSIATNEKFTNQQGEKVTETQWHSLVAWGKTAENIQKYLKKGSEVAIEGKLNNRSYEDKDGNKKYVSEVLVNEFLMFGKGDK